MTKVLLSHAPDKYALIAALAAHFVPFDGKTSVNYRYGGRVRVCAEYDHVGNLTSFWTTFFKTDIIDNNPESLSCYAFRNEHEINIFIRPFVELGLINCLNADSSTVLVDEVEKPCLSVADNKNPYSGISAEHEAIIDRVTGLRSRVIEGESSPAWPTITGVV